VSCANGACVAERRPEPTGERGRLIAPDSDAPPGDYSRCGRTDRGVSALGQVVALSVRRSAKAGAVEDMDYCGVLNRVLPEDILVTAWAPCSAEFDARFKCSSRTYRYYCVLPAESTNLDAMRRACRLFEGTHDFRNFCKMDVENAKHFVRRVESCRLVLEDEHGTGLGYCEIRGSAFLWHQVRMMMAVLFLVGQGLESPDLVTQMFNVEAMPRRPGYNMAPEAPLILFGTEFSEPLDWRISEQAKARLAQTLRARHESLSLSAAMSRAVLLGAFLDGERGGAAAAASSPLPPHVPLSARPVGKSYEEKVQALKGDKRLKHSAQRQGQESEEQSSHVAASFSSPLATDSASSARSFE
jgi:tRNA pseudouridine38/39 synthase